MICQWNIQKHYIYKLEPLDTLFRFGSISVSNVDIRPPNCTEKTNPNFAVNIARSRHEMRAGHSGISTNHSVAAIGPFIISEHDLIWPDFTRPRFTRPQASLRLSLSSSIAGFNRPLCHIFYFASLIPLLADVIASYYPPAYIIHKG